MENKINIAELLKDCPEGTKLYSPICGECELVRTYVDAVMVREIGNECTYAFQKTGKVTFSGECLLFPSKDNRDWSTFKEPQKEQPKFKVGDVVRDGNSLNIIVEIDGKCAIIDEGSMMRKSVNMEFLIPATPEEIALWNKETLEPNHLHYSKSKRKIIDWFLPFDKVVVRNYSIWYPRLFSMYLKKSQTEFCYACQDNMSFIQCLPYNEKTAKLIGTADNWEY